MARCCGNSTNVKIEEGRHVKVLGTGTAQDPFVIAGQTHLTVEETEQFQLVLTGNGTLDAPWLLRVYYAPGGGLDGLPDVDTEGATNGQVLGWDDTLEQWTPRAAPTANPGLITTGNGIDGDGSVGDPLVAVPDAARYLTLTASGIGLSDSGINRMVRVFADEFSRDNASPAPIEGTVGIVQADTSQLWYYDGAAWEPIIQSVGRDIESELLATSGNYSGGPVTTYIRQIEANTDGSGAFVVIPAEDLLDYSGVLSCKVIPTGTGTAWAPMVSAGVGIISGQARRISDGGALAGATITATVEATLY